MLKQFNLKQQIFDDPKIVQTEQGDLTFEVSGEGWFALYSQDEINAISASITSGGAVWVEKGKLKTSSKAPSLSHEWNKQTKKWEINEAKQAEQRTQQIAQIRQAINAKRDECVNGGVYVPLIDKWVDTNEQGRSTLVEIKADFDLNGHDHQYTLICADNSAVPLDFTAFKAVWDAVKTLKEKMFENAYMHKILLESSDHPQDYDWSIGWTETYATHLKAQQGGKDE